MKPRIPRPASTVPTSTPTCERATKDREDAKEEPGSHQQARRGLVEPVANGGERLLEQASRHLAIQNVARDLSGGLNQDLPVLGRLQTDHLHGITRGGQTCCDQVDARLASSARVSATGRPKLSRWPR